MTSKGDTGATGAVGSAGTVTVGTTTTGSTGGNASVSNSGTSSEAVLNFTIPKGSTGQQVQLVYRCSRFNWCNW